MKGKRRAITQKKLKEEKGRIENVKVCLSEEGAKWREGLLTIIMKREKE